MPPGILPTEGIADQLSYILRVPISGVLPWRLILWTNDITPTAATVLADLVEPDGEWYTPVSLQRDLWTEPEVTADCAVSTWGEEPMVWPTNDGPEETVYGYAMCEPTTGTLRFVQRFDDEDIAPLAIGSRATLLPRYTLTSGECAA